MKRKSSLFLALILILALVLPACGTKDAGPEPEEHRPAGDYQMLLVDEEYTSVFAGYASESPSIHDQPIPNAEGDGPRAVQTAAAKPEEVRSVWISYLELDTLLKGKTEQQFRSNIAAVFGNVKGLGLNTVIVQVRPFADALYPSDYFPWSYLATGAEGKDPGFDPLAVMVEEAKAKNLLIEAWVNPYRIRNSGSTVAQSSSSQAKKWLDAGDGAVIRYDGVISFNPASAKAQQLIVDGVREIAKNYKVDGIHIDDYFYPTTDAAFDKAYYDSYKSGGGSLSLANWRRANVENLIKKMYQAVKEENKNCLFGVSPQGSVKNNYDKQYLNVEKLFSQSGYCDYVCPQLYYGFQNEAQPFQETLEEWEALAKGSGVHLYVGIAAYKAGDADQWAGSGSGEWKQNQDLMKRMVQSSRKTSGYRGFVLYRYDSVFRPSSSVKGHVEQEVENLKSVL